MSAGTFLELTYNSIDALGRGRDYPIDLGNGGTLDCTIIFGNGDDDEDDAETTEIVVRYALGEPIMEYEAWVLYIFIGLFTAFSTFYYFSTSY